MSHEDYEFSMTVRVNDPERLLRAARAHPDAEGMPTEDFYDDAGEIDINACLVMLLDPGGASDSGIEILGSGSEHLELFEVDFGEEKN